MKALRAAVIAGAGLCLAQCGGSGSSGPPWTPAAGLGIGAGNHTSAIVVTRQTAQSATIPVIGMLDGENVNGGNNTVQFNFTIGQLGAYGSFTLQAVVSNVTGVAQGGGAFAMLVSLKDQAGHEYINLNRNGSSTPCVQNGYYTTSGGYLVPNETCSILYPSAYVNRTQWEEHQDQTASAASSPSVNTFPTCNWSGGSSNSSSGTTNTGAQVDSPSCYFTQANGWLDASNELNPGTWTATYVAISDRANTVSGYSPSGTIQFNVITKEASSQKIGAVDLNIILVGNTPVNASRTQRGAQSLNTLIASLVNYYEQSNVGVKIGTVTPIEWTAGDQYAELEVSQLYQMIYAANTSVIPASPSQPINIFIVDTITDDTPGADPNLTILGYDGAIGAPPGNGTAISGLTVSSFGGLDQLNPNCDLSSVTCPVSRQDYAFHSFAHTVAHEMGHYFGLNHPAEADASEFDYLNDTPICTAPVCASPDATSSDPYPANYVNAACSSNESNNADSNDNFIQPTTCAADTNVQTDGHSCKATCVPYDGNSDFCPTSVDCAFNYIMFWTLTNFDEGSGIGDGELFSPQSGTVINYTPFVY